MSSILLLIDVQRDMLEPPEPVPDAATVAPLIAELLTRARAAGALVVHVRNNGGDDDPDAPGTPGWELVNTPKDGEPVIDKTEPDAFAGTGLADVLPAGAHLAVVGMQSEFCVRATVLEALRRGHPVSLVRGAHATYDCGPTPASVTSAQVELEVRAQGASLVEPSALRFTPPTR